MRESADLIWKGERNRLLDVYRPCECCVCSKSSKGVGYLSFSDTNGNGFTVWIKDETIFRRLATALRLIRHDRRKDRLSPEKWTSWWPRPKGPRDGAYY